MDDNTAKQILADIEHRERTGVWPSPIPSWLIEVATKTNLSYYSEGTIREGYAYAARLAVIEADELRTAYATQCAEHMGTVALASRLSHALEWSVGAEGARRVVEGGAAVVGYGEGLKGTDNCVSKIDRATSVLVEHAMASIHKIASELEHFDIRPGELRHALDLWVSMSSSGARGQHFEDALLAHYEARYAKRAAGGSTLGSRG